MRADVARLDVRNRRRLTIGYAVGMALYMLVIVALYPSFKDSTGLDRFSSDNATIAALFGAAGTLTSPAGWVDANAYTNFFPLIMLLLTIGYGAAAIAGQDDDGTLGLVVALPLARRDLVLQKALAMLAMAAGLAAAVTATVYVGRAFEVMLDPWNVAATSLAVMLVGLDFGLLALGVGAATGSRGTALGVSSAAATACYLVSSLAPVVGWIGPLRFASPFYWSAGNGQLAGGVGLGSFAVLIGIALAAGAGASVAFTRYDVR